MQIEEIKQKAKAAGLKVPAGKVKKLELIRRIQAAEGNFPCFGTSDGYCDQTGCCFAPDCLTKNY